MPQLLLLLLLTMRRHLKFLNLVTAFINFIQLIPNFLTIAFVSNILLTYLSSILIIFPYCLILIILKISYFHLNALQISVSILTLAHINVNIQIEIRLHI